MQIYFMLGTGLSAVDATMNARIQSTGWTQFNKGSWAHKPLPYIVKSTTIHYY